VFECLVETCSERFLTDAQRLQHLGAAPPLPPTFRLCVLSVCVFFQARAARGVPVFECLAETCSERFSQIPSACSTSCCATTSPHLPLCVPPVCVFSPGKSCQGVPVFECLVETCASWLPQIPSAVQHLVLRHHFPPPSAVCSVCVFFQGRAARGVPSVQVLSGDMQRVVLTDSQRCSTSCCATTSPHLPLSRHTPGAPWAHPQQPQKHRGKAPQRRLHTGTGKGRGAAGARGAVAMEEEEEQGQVAQMQGARASASASAPALTSALLWPLPLLQKQWRKSRRRRRWRSCKGLSLSSQFPEPSFHSAPGVH